jgi:hypothetical protein
LLPNLAEDIKSLLEMHSQAHPKFQTNFAFNKMSASSVREASISGWVELNIR